jgi:hypothetical protein
VEIYGDRSTGHDRDAAQLVAGRTRRRIGGRRLTDGVMGAKATAGVRAAP